MALCLLAKHWWQQWRESGIFSEKVTGIVVDHGLRPESGAEALQVQHWVQNLGFDCHVLKYEWTEGQPDTGRLQESARNARYALMEQTCWRHGIGTLLTGHHADDQAELFIMRLARNSGIIGLAGMAFVSHFYSRWPTRNNQTGLLLVRPLLQFTKQDLYTVCKHAGQEWVEDPTNINRTFARNRIRQALADPVYSEANQQIHHLVAACRKTRYVLDKERDKVLAKAVSISKDFAYAAMNVPLLASNDVSDAVLARVLVAMLQEAFTLAGCHVSPVPGSKGYRLMVCLSPDSPTPATSLELSPWEPSAMKNLGTCDSEEVQPSCTEEADFEGSTIPILDTQDGAPSILVQGKELGLVSEAVSELLRSLQIEVAATMSKTVEDGRLVETNDKEIPFGQDSRKQLLPFKKSCYFMNRFLISWSPKIAAPASNQLLCMTLSGDERGRCCLMREQPDAWVRNYEDADWNQLSQVLKTSFASKRQDRVSNWCVYQYENDLYGGSKERRQQMQLEHEMRAPKRDTSKKPKKPKRKDEAPIYCGGIVTAKAQRALALLRHIPRPVRRGLPVLVNAEGLLLAFLALGFQRCPWISVSAVFHPRIPVGGGPTSWT